MKRQDSFVFRKLSIPVTNIAFFEGIAMSPFIIFFLFFLQNLAICYCLSAQLIKTSVSLSCGITVFYYYKAKAHLHINLGSMIVTFTTIFFYLARVGASCNFSPRDVGGVQRNVAKGSEVL